MVWYSEGVSDLSITAFTGGCRMTTHFGHGLRISRSVAIGLLHAGCFIAPFQFSWAGLWIAVIMYPVTAMIGITLCYHRLLTHESFKTYRGVKYLLILCACLAWQGGPMKWVGTHRRHHVRSDQKGDPHSPKEGFSWSHIWWTVHKNDLTQGEIERRTQDLREDPVIVFIDRFFWAPQILFGVFCYILGEVLWRKGFETSGLSCLVWGVAVRTVFVYHVTWLVNSASHTWGYRNFKTPDNSRNNWVVALLAAGEGWHNNHHAKPKSAAHGLRWWEFDLTFLVIRLMQFCGLAWDLNVAKWEKPE